MTCRKYTLINTGTTAVNFNYRRCDDTMWKYQVNLDSNQTKNIWLIDGTYSIPLFFNSQVILIDDGIFPPIPTDTGSYLLQENLFNILQEDGFKINIT